MKELKIYIPDPDLTITCYVKDTDPVKMVRDKLLYGHPIVVADDKKGQKTFVIPHEVAKKSVFAVSICAS